MGARVVSRIAGLGGLTAAGQLLIIGSLPAYSRVFDPDAYGAYVIFVGAYTVVSVLAGVRYDSAIVLPRGDGMAAALSALVMLIALAVAALITLATSAAWLAGAASVAGLSATRDFGYGLAAGTTLGAMQRCLTGWCIRNGSFLRMGAAQFVFCLVSVVAQLSLAAVLAPLAALVWGYVCALAAQVAWLAIGQGLCGRAATPAQLLRGMRVAARRYRRFPTYMVGYALASSARDRLIQIVLGIGAGAAAVGRFGLAYRVVFAPNSLIYSAVSPVFYRVASRGSRAAVGHFAAALVEAVFIVLVVPYLACILEAPALTDAALSDKWRGTGPYVQALAGPALLLAATCWLDRAFDSFRRQNVAFLLEASFTVVSVLVVAGLARLADPLTVVWVFGSLALLYYWIYFVVTFSACGFPMHALRRASVNIALVSGVVLCGALAIHRLEQPALRLALYVGLMAAVLAVWFTWLGGARRVRALGSV
jgi:O-antigen/teichoic acid export membrane protein